jgi:ABC-2 type transport system permease protein
MNINRALVITISELKQVWNNKRFLALLVLAPIIISIGFGFIAYQNPAGIDTTIFVDSPFGLPDSSEIQNIINDIGNYVRDDGSKPFMVKVELNSRQAALERLDAGLTRAVVILDQGSDGQLSGVEVFCGVGDTVISGAVEKELGNYFDSYAQEISSKQLAAVMVAKTDKVSPVFSTRNTSISSGVPTTFLTDAWKTLRYFDFYASAMIVIISVGMPLTLSVISITSERSRGTIERIFVSPFHKSEIILGKVIAHSLFAVILSVLFVGALKILFDVALGNIGLVLLLAILVGINAAVLGLLISSITYSEFESVTIGIMSMLGIMASMTYLFPWETMHPSIRIISGLIPFTYGIQTIRQVNMLGVGISQVWPNLLILIGFIILLVLISIPVLKREIK